MQQFETSTITNARRYNSEKRVEPITTAKMWELIFNRKLLREFLEDIELH